ncbi:MAG: hypothetical protein M3280_13000 [Actinomycetota bacterium]|nr:hypothetical protein [Actinomycetota bacterium]
MVRWWGEFVGEVEQRWGKKKIQRHVWFLLVVGAISAILWPQGGFDWWEIPLTVVPMLLFLAMLRTLRYWPFQSN